MPSISKTSVFGTILLGVRVFRVSHVRLFAVRHLNEADPAVGGREARGFEIDAYQREPPFKSSTAFWNSSRASGRV